MARKKPTQAGLIRRLAAKKIPIETFVAHARKACGGKPTHGYDRWTGKQTK